VYNYFSDSFIWPRGFALEHLHDKVPMLGTFPQRTVTCPIQQGLADQNPDVDAIYRLSYPLPFNFSSHIRLALGKDSWCPFNSQNTTWFRDVFMLLYLPSYCSFRMTDIWRSFVALRILHENNLFLLFHPHTVWQKRNEHNLLKDFADEVPGYLNNGKIVKALSELNIRKGEAYYGDNLLACYTLLTDMGLVDAKELPLVEAWIRDVEKM
jgi:hypothetical protein